MVRKRSYLTHSSKNKDGEADGSTDGRADGSALGGVCVRWTVVGLAHMGVDPALELNTLTQAG